MPKPPSLPIISTALVSKGATCVDQSGVTALNDVIGRDNNAVTNNIVLAAPTVIETLLQKLEAEMENDTHTKDIIEQLQRYYCKKSHDGIAGLEAKLSAANRSATYMDAIEMKEMFVKLLEKWSLYGSAQQIFVHLLARAERQFNDIILPAAPNHSIAEVNVLTSKLIVEPTVQDCGASVFEVDQNVAMGMVYWLAEQCFIRWHS